MECDLMFAYSVGTCVKVMQNHIPHDIGAEVVDWQDFANAVRENSDVDDVLDYHGLVEKIKMAADAEHSWAKWKTTLLAHSSTTAQSLASAS